MSEEMPKVSVDKYGIKKTDDGYKVDAKSLLESVGGVQGIVEASLPGFLYVLSFAIFRDVTISVVTVVVSVVLLTIRHLIKKRPISGLIGSFIGIALAIYLTVRPEGQAKDFYLPGFWQNGAYGAVLLLSVIVRYPVIGCRSTIIYY